MGCIFNSGQSCVLVLMPNLNSNLELTLELMPLLLHLAGIYSFVSPIPFLPACRVSTTNFMYLFFIKIMIKPSIVLMIRQITIMWKFLLRISVAWFFRFSLNTSVIWTMYFWILKLVIARMKSEILTMHWGKLLNTNLAFCILFKIIFASNRLFSVLFNFRISFFNCWVIVAFA